MRLIARNLAALMWSQIASWGLTLALLVVVPHYLGDAQYGRLSFAGAFVGFFGLVATFGTNTYLTREIARDSTRLASYVFNVMMMKVPLLLFLSLAAIGLAYLLGYPRETCLLVAIVCLGMGARVLAGPLLSGLAGEQRMGWTAAWTTVERYVAGAAALLVLAAHWGLAALALSASITAMIPLFANGAVLFRRLQSAARLDLGLWKVVTLGSLPFLMWDLTFAIYNSVDVTILSFLTGDAVVGWYVLAYRLIAMPGFVPTLLIAAMFPALSASGLSVSPDFCMLTNRALRGVCLVTVPMAVGLAFVAGDLITLFHYPSQFGHSVPLIRILAVYVPLAAAGTVLGAAIMANDRQKQLVVFAGIAAVLNPLLNLAAIPLTTHAFGNGAVGASIVTVLTEGVMIGGTVYLRPHGVLDKQTLSYLGRCVLASVFMGSALLVAANASLPLRIGGGAFVYGAASLFLRTISLRESWQAGRYLFGPRRLGQSSGASG